MKKVRKGFESIPKFRPPRRDLRVLKVLPDSDLDVMEVDEDMVTFDSDLSESKATSFKSESNLYEQPDFVSDLVEEILKEKGDNYRYRPTDIPVQRIM